MRCRLGPDHKHIGNRRVGNPHLGTADAITAINLVGARFHASRIGTRIRFGQTETANQLARNQTRQIFLALLIRTVGVNRIHHERRLHTHHGAVARIDTLNFARHQTIRNIASIGCAIFFRQRYAKKTSLPHQTKQIGISRFIKISFFNARQENIARKSLRRIADHALIFGQLLIEQKRIFPVKYGTRHE